MRHEGISIEHIDRSCLVSTEMKAIILAAGYGVRLERDLYDIKKRDTGLYEKIKDSIEGRSKPLVLIAGKPLIEYLVRNIEIIDEIDEIIIVTNSKYFGQFNAWCLDYRSKKEITLLDDGTSINEDRLGAVGDLLFALSKKRIDEDILVVAGDNLLKFDLNELIRFFHEKKANVLVAYPEDKEKIKRSACLDLDADGRVNYFEEKPENPRTGLVCPAVYVYTRNTVNLIKKIGFDIGTRDLIGNIPMLLYKETPFYALKKNSRIRFDLGKIDDFRDAVSYAEKQNTAKDAKVK